MRSLSALLTFLLLLSAPNLRAQFAESIEVSIANVDVVVVDRAGKPVRGLTKGDFQILEDGNSQEITNFAEYTSEPRQAVTADAARDLPAPPPPRPRIVAIVIDIDDIDPRPREMFFGNLRQFVTRSMRDGDQATVLAWTNRMRTVVPVTTSIKEIDSALDGFQKARRWSELEILESLAEDRIRAAQDAAANPPAGGIAIDVGAEKDFEEWLIAEQRCSRIKRKIEAIRELVASMAALDRQKILVLASDDLSLQPERTCLMAADLEGLAALANSYGVRIDAFHPPGERSKFAGAFQINRVPSIVDAPSNAGQAPRTFDEAGGLLLLADRTGGRAALGPVPAGREMERTAIELENYYSLAYRLSPGRLDQARKIRVVTKNRSYSVRARSSVTALSDASRLRDSLITSLYSANPGTGRFPVQLELKEAVRDGKVVRLKVIVRFPLRSLALLPAGGGNVKGTFSVMTAAGQELGDASAVSSQEQTFTRPEASVNGAQNIEYAFDVRVRPYTRKIAIAVRDEITKEYGVATMAVPGVTSDKL